MRLCVLASGSGGNSAFASTGSSGLLIDAGLSCRETERRLAALGASLTQVQAVCISHEHDDHTGTLAVIHRRTGAVLYANAGTIDGIEKARKITGLPWRVFTNGAPFAVGDITVTPFQVPHDAYDPVGFLLAADAIKAGVVTDMGIATTLIRERLKGCRWLVIEANHDKELLHQARRPWSLKQRIAGMQGHLSNEQAAELLAEVAGPELRVVVLAHLSKDCNRPELAMGAVQKKLAEIGRSEIVVRAASPDQPICLDSTTD